MQSSAFWKEIQKNTTIHLVLPQKAVGLFWRFMLTLYILFISKALKFLSLKIHKYLQHDRFEEYKISTQSIEKAFKIWTGELVYLGINQSVSQPVNCGIKQTHFFKLIAYIFLQH